MRGLLSKLSKQEKYYLYSCVALIAASALYILIVSPAARGIIQLNKYIKQKEGQLTAYMRIIEAEDRLSREYSQYKDKISKLAPASEQEEQISMINEIERLFKQSNIHVTNFIPYPMKEREGYRIFSVNVECESQVNDLYKFLNGLQESQQLLTVDKIEMMPKDTATKLLRIRCSISKIALGLTASK